MARAEASICLGEVSAARQALEAAELAPGTNATLELLRDPTRRPPVITVPIPEAVQNFRPVEAFALDGDKFIKNLRGARKGAAGGPSGMTSDHLRVILDDEHTTDLLLKFAQYFTSAKIPAELVEALRLGRLTALEKQDGGVRGIISGDIFRRLVARTIAQQIGNEVEVATAPYQYALSTRAGTECVAHVLKYLSDANINQCVCSYDGIGAFDNIRRARMLSKLHTLPEASGVLPFVR